MSSAVQAPSLPAGYRLRDVDRDADLARVVQLLRICDEHDAGMSDASEAWLRDDWRSSSIKGAIVAETEAGEVVGYLSLEAFDPASSVTMYYPLAPSVRAALRDPWTAYCAGRVEGLAGPTAIRYAVVAAEEEAGPSLEVSGYGFARVFWHMERSVDNAYRAGRPPDGVAIRAYDAQADDRLVWRLVEDSFSEHYGQEPQSWESWQEDMLGASTWDPDLVWIAELAGEPVGVVICQEIDGVGWIGDLGVLKSARGRGIGRALLEHGFAILAARGRMLVRLNVDSDNETGAAGLYERAGMHVLRAFHCYERPGPGE
ncbi:MAG TPA: GNAT family N-acetyltransferase [Actinomycetota bacterium]|nr:GNAT family N-acetyltransferase [Actinomycetota bacterium]